jgi:hypothetical protein
VKGHLVLTRTDRTCHTCRARTPWATEAQLGTDRGVCLDHARGLRERAPELTEREAIHLLVRVLGVDRVEVAPPARPNGPCALCRTTVVRYGPDAISTLCVACGGPEPRRTT